MRDRQGFTLVEAVVACCLLSLLGLAMGQMFLSVTRSLGHNKGQQKASALGEMVMEQYDAISSRDPSRLPEFNRQNATPAEFFKTKDDLGYDGMRISALATPSSKTGGANISVTINWKEGPAVSSMTLTKYYLEGIQTPADPQTPTDPQKMSGL